MTGPPPPSPIAPAAGQATIAAFLGSLSTTLNWSYAKPFVYLQQNIGQPLNGGYNDTIMTFQIAVADPYGGFKSSTPDRWTPGLPGWYMVVGAVVGNNAPMYVRIGAGGQVQGGLPTSAGITYGAVGPGLVYVPNATTYFTLQARCPTANSSSTSAYLAAWYAHP